MSRLQTTIALVIWEILMVISVGISIESIIAFILALPVFVLVMYLIWFDSKRPKAQQFRFYNSRFGKKGA